MNPPSARRSHATRFALVASALLVAVALVVPRSEQAPLDRSISEANAAQEATLRAEIDRSLEAAAAARRGGNRGEARRILRTLVERLPSRAPVVDAVLGLQAYEEGRWSDALAALRPVALPPDHELADWRLLALAESSTRSDSPDEGERAMTLLLEEHPESLLCGFALARMAAIHEEAGDLESALSLLDRALGLETSRTSRRELEILAWRLGRRAGDQELERRAARRLLVTAPGLAADLGVLDSMPGAGSGRWEGILTDAEVLQRARAWLAEGSPVFAEAALDAVAPEARGLEWSLVRAEALTAQNRGGDAYLELLALPTSRPDEAARVEWQRALAAADLATARRGRAPADSATRRRWLERSREHLARVVAFDPPNDLSVKALRALYAQLSDEGRFDDSMTMLRQLQRLDPDDRTGASHLWDLGWQEFRSANYTGAIGYWSQLEQIYPDDRETHRGRYWKARALEQIGQGSRARQMYRDLIRTSDTADFYVRRARGRLAGEVPLQTPGSLSLDWPQDPWLHRVLRLSDLGLDDLAARELELIHDETLAANARDALALRGILAVRRGETRVGVPRLRDAFPSLGGPYQAAVPRPVLEAYYPYPFQETIERHARKRGLDPPLVAAMVRQESAFDPHAESWAGARGLMQLMPSTAREVSRRLGHSWRAARLFEPDFSVELGTTYFRQVLDKFDGNVELALAGYNGGPNRIRRLWREAGPHAELDRFLEGLSIAESQNYVKRILVLSDSYRQLYPPGPREPWAPASDGPSALPDR